MEQRRFWDTRPGRAMATGVTGLLALTLAGCPKPNSVEERADISKGATFYYLPNPNFTCGTSNKTARHVKIVQHQDGFAAFSDSDMTDGLPGFTSDCDQHGGTRGDNDNKTWVSEEDLQNDYTGPAN